MYNDFKIEIQAVFLMIRPTLFEFDYSALHREIISRNNLCRSCCDARMVIHRNDWFTSTMITTTNILATRRLASTSLLYLFSATGEWVNRESHRHATGLYWRVTKFQPSTISCRATRHCTQWVGFRFSSREEDCRSIVVTLSFWSLHSISTIGC